MGTRAPKLSLEDLGKAANKLLQWIRSPQQAVDASVSIPGVHHQTSHENPLDNLTVVTPKMYPGFRKNWQRKLNAKLISKTVNRSLGRRQADERRVAISTIPITADLAETLDVDAWIYYCVDDFSVWPGLDGRVMEEMDQKLATHSDAILCVSKTLQKRVSNWGCESQLLTHGIHLDHWTDVANNKVTGTLPNWWQALPNINDKEKSGTKKPIALFWGVVDQRLDSEWCSAITQQGATLILLGPQQSPDPKLSANPNIIMPGPAPYEQLPLLAQAANVLVMPYADLPVTRAIQPLKFKEYLATGKPVISRKLPATEPWADAADVLTDVESLKAALTDRIAQGTPDSQLKTRKRLVDESWAAKASQLESCIKQVAQASSEPDVTPQAV